MNVTPLVDVVLVLLIIFMVVTPLLTKKLWIPLPKNEKVEEPPPDDVKPVVISVARDGAVRLNAQEISRAELGDRVARVLAARADEVIFFDADGETPYGDAVSVMDIVRGAGARIAVLTEGLSQ
jgi:biopolymer transport protein ExbD/biopolymer transport protein TolR